MKVKITVKDREIRELQGTRDLLGKQMFVAAKGPMDLELGLRHPLILAPFSLANGSISKTDKSNALTNSGLR